MLNSFSIKIQEYGDSNKSSNHKAQILYIVVTFYLFREEMTLSRVK